MANYLPTMNTIPNPNSLLVWSDLVNDMLVYIHRLAWTEADDFTQNNLRMVNKRAAKLLPANTCDIRYSYARLFLDLRMMFNKYIRLTPLAHEREGYQWKIYRRDHNVFRCLVSSRKYGLCVNPLPKKFSVDYEIRGYIYHYNPASLPETARGRLFWNISRLTPERITEFVGNITHGFKYALPTWSIGNGHKVLDRVCHYSSDGEYIIFKNLLRPEVLNKPRKLIPTGILSAPLDAACVRYDSPTCRSADLQMAASNTIQRTVDSVGTDLRQSGILVAISGLSGTGKSTLCEEGSPRQTDRGNPSCVPDAEGLPNIFSDAIFIHEDDYFVSEKPLVKLSNGEETRNWDCREAINFTFFNSRIESSLKESKLVILDGFMLPDDLLTIKPDIHILLVHLSAIELAEGTTSSTVERRVIEARRKTKPGARYDDLVVRELVMPAYASTIARTSVTHIIPTYESGPDGGSRVPKTTILETVERIVRDYHRPLPTSVGRS